MIGYESRRRGHYCWNGLTRGSEEFMLWQYGLEGFGSLRFEDREYLMSPGQAMLVKIPHDHCYEVHRQSSVWEFIFIILRGSECMRIGSGLIERFGPVTPSYRSRAVLETAEKIINSDEGADPWKMSAAAYSFLMEMGAKNQWDSAGTAVSESLKNARRFALKNFAFGIGVEDMANAAGMSYSHFSREFMAHCRVSPGVFLLQLKLEKALNLLQTNDLSIKEIALKSGFSSASYFCRAFLRKYGAPPGNFRSHGAR